MAKGAKLGERSIKRLSSCHPEIIRLVRWVEERIYFDITVLEGKRSDERQQELFSQGFSQLDGVSRKSKHQRTPSDAIDIAPYPVDWDDKNKFYLLAGYMLAGAAELGLDIRWGGDWDRDGDLGDSSFIDLPHFERMD